MWKKTVINRLLDFSGVLYNFEINYTLIKTHQMSFSNYLKLINKKNS
jgi:hypothetical protein